MPRISTDNYDTVASWNGSQDLFVVEQPDGTKVATPEQVKQYVLNDMDEVPTQNSNNPVKSGGIFSTMAVPKYDATNRREYYEGGSAFSGNIDSTPTAGSNNAVASGGTYTAINERIKCGIITSPSRSVTANNHMLVDIPLSAPLPSTLVAVFVIFTPNSAWLFANVQDYDNTRIRIGVYNTHPSAAIEGVYKVAYLYT